VLANFISDLVDRGGVDFADVHIIGKHQLCRTVACRFLYFLKTRNWEIYVSWSLRGYIQSGFSLGAQVSGHAANWLKQTRKGSLVGRITGKYIIIYVAKSS
jgi:hypothetical protein